MAAVSVLFCSCGGSTARITGQSLGLESRTVTLEEALPYGVRFVDSTRTDAQGNYRFRVELPEDQPTLYNLRIDGQAVPLLVSPGEKVKVFSLPGNARNYTVEGSRESELIQEINDILGRGAASLDSLADARSLRSGSMADDRRAGMLEYSRIYNGIKRDQIRFIVENSSTLAAIYALERRLPGDRDLFGGVNDVVYYQMVADSVSKTYPDSPYLMLLRNAIRGMRAGQELLDQFNRSVESPASFLEVSLPDIYGTVHNLSDNTGSVILLDFWSAAEAMAAMMNAEYKEIYDDFSDRGFVIYQVNMDTSKPVWVNAVLNQKLSWISVSDLQGPRSPVAGSYNITEVPSNFLINADGDIVARNIFGEALRKELEKQLKTVD